MDAVRAACRWAVLAVASPSIRPADTYLPDTSAKTGTWFLPPEQHGAELVLFTALYLPIFCAGYAALSPLAPAYAAPQLAAMRARKGSWMWTVLRTTGVVLLAIFARTVAWKMDKGSLAFMLQPCHIFSLSLTVMLLVPGSRLALLLFNAHLFVMWAPWLALAMPDLRTYEPYSLELASFFLQHVIIAFLPPILLLTGVFPVLPRRAAWMACGFGFWALYQVWALGFGSLLSGINLNYMLAPPPVVEASTSPTVALLVPYYRWPTQLVTALCAFLTGVVLPALLAPCTPRLVTPHLAKSKHN